MDTRKIIVTVSWVYNNYCAVSEQVMGCVATGSSLQEAKENYSSALEYHREGVDIGELDECVQNGDYELVYELSATALLKHYSTIVSLKAISSVTGIHIAQLSHYINGVKSPRSDKRAKIVAGLHQLGNELITVQ